MLDPADDRRIARREARRAAPPHPAGDDEPDRLEHLARQRSASDRRHRFRNDDARPGLGRKRLEHRVGATAERLGRRRDHPPDGDVGGRPSSAIQPESRGKGGQGHLVGPHGAGQRVLAGCGR